MKMMKFSQKLPNSVINSKSKHKREDIVDEYDVFGKELKALEELYFSKEIPEIIWMMGYFIKTYGLLAQGLFRISGNKSRMDDIKTSYIKKRSIEVGVDDIHNITSLYKHFIREIPDGLIPFTQASDLIKAMKSFKDSENLDLLKSELLKMPVPNYNLLKYTCSLLHVISQYSSSNLMTADNLGMIFGPTFFVSLGDMASLSLQNSLASLLIYLYNDLFKVSAPVHVNLNESSNYSNRFDSLPSITSVNRNLTNCSGDQNLTLKFGDSLMTVNISQEDLQVSASYMDDENCQILSESVDWSYNTNGSCSASNNNSIYNSGYPNRVGYSYSSAVPHTVSNPMAMAIKMCISNHLGLDIGMVSQSHPSGDLGSVIPLAHSSNTDSLASSSSYQMQYAQNQQLPPQLLPPYLISDAMLNPDMFHYQSLQHKMSNSQQNHYFDMENLGYQYQQNLSQASVDQQNEALIQNRRRASVLGVSSSKSQAPLGIMQQQQQQQQPEIPPRSNQFNGVNNNKIVPQLDLSVLHDLSQQQNERDIGLQPQQETQQTNKNVRQNRHNSIDVGQLALDRPILPEEMTDSSQLLKRISYLKKQLRSFDDDYFERHGSRPDKTAKIHNSWYKNAVAELKQLRLLKERMISGGVSHIEEESEEFGASFVDRKAPGHFVFNPNNQETRSNVSSRPVSAMSDMVPSVGGSRITNTTAINAFSESERNAGLIPDTPITGASCNTVNNQSGGVSATTVASGVETAHKTAALEDITDHEIESLKSYLEDVSLSLEQERRKKGRPDDIEEMTPAQIENEKVTMQKLLLGFESKYGRSKNSRAVQMMKPLYDRYRQVKKKLVTYTSSTTTAKETQGQHQAWSTVDNAATATGGGGSGSGSVDVKTATTSAIVMPSVARWTSDSESVDIQNEHQHHQHQHVLFKETDDGFYKANLTNYSANNAQNKPAVIPRQSKNSQIRRYEPHVTAPNNNNGNDNSRKNSMNAPNLENDGLVELKRLMVEKKNLQKILKEFENNFEKETNRKVERSDRLPMSREYIRYRQIKNRIKELEELLNNPLLSEQ